MIKKKVLFLCASYRSGGAERGFVSLLNVLPLDKIEAHVMVLEPIGLFANQLPNDIIIEPAPIQMIGLCAQRSGEYYKKVVPWYIEVQKIFIILKGILFNRKKKLGAQQFFWKEGRKHIPDNPSVYDAVISFSDGTCNYYSIDKVSAPLKYLWYHNDYDKLGDNSEFDLIYFQKATRVSTISTLCMNSLQNNFPSLIDKFQVVENVSPATLIQKRCLEEPQGFTKEGFDITFCSVGRMFPQKGYDLAIAAAKILKEHGMNFCWYIIGDGELRGEIQSSIEENNLSENFCLLGIRENPYTYIHNADIFVMTSRFEGKSIALDEAKILNKPILSTKYPSVFDNIKDGVNGVLVDQTPESIAEGLFNLSNNKELRYILVENLKRTFHSNEKSVCNQIMDMINSKF